MGLDFLASLADSVCMETNPATEAYKVRRAALDSIVRLWNLRAPRSLRLFPALERIDASLAEPHHPNWFCAADFYAAHGDLSRAEEMEAAETARMETTT